MLEKNEILIVIILLLVAFYFVISIGASKKGKTPQSPEINRYLLSVKILIILIGLVSLILWFFL